MGPTRFYLAAVTVLALGLVAWRLWPATQQTASGSPMVAVSVPELGPLEQRGRTAFDASCATCHGDNAAGRDGIAPPLVHIIYEPDHHGDAAFLLAVRSGVRQHHWRFGDMPAVEGVREEDIVAIVAYVRALQRANGID